MKFKEVEDKTKLQNDFDSLRPPELAVIYGINIRTVGKWRLRLKKMLEETNKETKKEIKDTKPSTHKPKDYSVTSEDNKEIHKLKCEIKELKKSIKVAQEEVVLSDGIKSLITGIKTKGLDTKAPKWIEKNNKSAEMIPCIQLTDIHYGETQRKEEVNNSNEYNKEICERRVNQVVDDFIGICKNNLSNYTYPGVVCVLSGDNLTGQIHDLAEPNDQTPIEQVIGITNILIGQIRKLNKEFTKVFCPFVTGNHGRMSKFRTKTKGRVNDSLETLVFHFVSMAFDDNDDVTFMNSESDELYFSINGRRFILMHGDNFKGGSGIGGVVVPIKRGRAKKLESANNIGKAFDTMIIGHFHQHHIEDGLIIGNSVKGYDSFCQMLGIPYSPPGCTSFFINTHGEIVFGTNLICRDGKTPTKREQSIEIF